MPAEATSIEKEPQMNRERGIGRTLSLPQPELIMKEEGGGRKEALIRGHRLDAQEGGSEVGLTRSTFSNKRYAQNGLERANNTVAWYKPVPNVNSSGFCTENSSVAKLTSKFSPSVGQSTNSLLRGVAWSSRFRSVLKA